MAERVKKSYQVRFGTDPQERRLVLLLVDRYAGHSITALSMWKDELMLTDGWMDGFDLYHDFQLQKCSK